MGLRFLINSTTIAPWRFTCRLCSTVATCPFKVVNAPSRPWQCQQEKRWWFWGDWHNWLFVGVFSYGFFRAGWGGHQTKTRTSWNSPGSVQGAARNQHWGGTHIAKTTMELFRYLVNYHNYGKSPFWMGKSTIIPLFLWSCSAMLTDQAGYIEANSPTALHIATGSTRPARNPCLPKRHVRCFPPAVTHPSHP